MIYQYMYVTVEKIIEERHFELKQTEAERGVIILGGREVRGGRSS